MDPSRLNSDDNPFEVKYRDRSEIIAEQLKYLTWSSDPAGLYPGAAGGKASVMTPGQKIDYWYQELVSRRNFVVALVDRYGFTSAEEILAFIREETPWYWQLGVLEYESLLNRADELAEYLQSSFSENLSEEGYAGRYLQDEDYLLLINTVGRTDSWERSMLDTEKSIGELSEQWNLQYASLASESGRLSLSLYDAYRADLRRRGIEIADLQVNKLNTDYGTFIEEGVFNRLHQAVRKKKLDLALENLADYKEQVIEGLLLDEAETAEVEADRRLSQKRIC